MSKDPYKTTVKPQTGPNRSDIYEDEKEFRHESYAVVGFHRITGHSGRMLGSSLPDQGTFIRLRVNRASRYHNLGHDRFSTAGNPLLLELDLSNAQFAELLTGMNHGEGVPCTLRFAEGREMERCPEEKLEAQQIRDDFEDKLKQVARNMGETRKRIDEILAKKSISQADRKEVVSLLKLVEQDVHSNMPFWLDQFHVSAGKIVTSAKAEIDAFMTNAVMQAGYKALAETIAPITMPAMLTEGTDKKEDK